MIVRWLGADAHEFARADLDDRNARVVVEMRNDVVGHDLLQLCCDARHHSRAVMAFIVVRFLIRSNSADRKRR